MEGEREKKAGKLPEEERRWKENTEAGQRAQSAGQQKCQESQIPHVKCAATHITQSICLM